MEDKNELLELIYNTTNKINETFIKKLLYGDIEFNYFDLDTINTIIQGDTEEIKKIFKLNFGLICKILQENYSDINININLDSSNCNELRIKGEMAFKHDVYISFEYLDKLYECGFDFIEKNKKYVLSEEDDENIYLYDKQKHISGKVNVDYYDEYYEYIDDYKFNQKYEYFIENAIYRILLVLAAIKEDEYKLAEILFVQANKDSEDITSKLDYFKEILNIKKNNIFNLEKWYELTMPTNPKTGEDFTYKQFIKHIKKQVMQNFENDIIISENGDIDFDTFYKIIMSIDSGVSFCIILYRKTFLNVFETLMISLKTINKLLMQINKTKRYIPEYIDNVIETLKK